MIVGVIKNIFLVVGTVLAAIIVGGILQDPSPGLLFVGGLFLVCLVWLVVISGGVGTIIRKDDGTYVKDLRDLDDEDPRNQPPRF